MKNSPDSEKPSDMVKIYKIEPAPSSAYDTLIVATGDTWRPALDAVEQSLEHQFFQMEDGDISWEDIVVTVRCGLMSRADLEEGQERSVI